MGTDSERTSGGGVKKKIPENVVEANTHFKWTVHYLTEYINDQVKEKGSIKNLSKKTGIPRTTITQALRRGNILGLRKLAYRLCGLKAEKGKQ
jgi:hypothetical protein